MLLELFSEANFLLFAQKMLASRGIENTFA